jgi:hypothetical protein
MKTKAVEKEPLDLVSCDSIDTAAMGINFVKNPVIDYYDCIDIKTEKYLGEDNDKQLKYSIEIEIFPCLENCYINNFTTPPLVLGLKEIKPSNLVAYQAYMNRFLANYVLLFGYINSIFDLTNFAEPINKGMGLPIDMSHSLNQEVHRKIVFGKLMVETYSGYFKRSVKVDRSMMFKGINVASKKRKTLNNSFGKVEIELSNDMTLVQRIYPNIIDLFSDVGGLAKVIIAACLIFGHFHNDILMETTVINRAIIESDSETKE